MSLIWGGARVAQEQEFDWTVATAERAAAYLKQLNVPPDIEPPSLLKTHLTLDEKVEAVSAEVSAELGEIVLNIDDALRSTGNFGLSLEALMPHLGGALRRATSRWSWKRLRPRPNMLPSTAAHSNVASQYRSY